MINTTANGYQGQICSADYLNSEMTTGSIISLSSSQYIEKLGIYAPPGAKFQITQKANGITSTAEIEIGKTFMYEAYNSYIT